MAISKLIPTVLLAGLSVYATGPYAAVAHAGVETQAAARPHPSPTPAASAPADELKKAEDWLELQQYQRAEQLLLAIVEKQSTNPQAWFDLGFAQGHLGKTADSIAAYRKAVELSPRWFEARQNLGLALAQSGDYSAAVAALKIAVTLSPPLPGRQQALSKAWTYLAQFLDTSGAMDDVLPDFKKAVELDPTNDDAQFGVASASYRIGLYADAEQTYLKLAAKRHSAATWNLVALYVEQKRYPEAETWARKYVADNPGDKSAQIPLGRLLAAQGKTQEAIAALEPVYDVNHDPMIARDLAGLYLDAKQYDTAATVLQPLVARTPTDPQLHFDYGSALLHQHKYPEAQAELTKAVQLKPGLVEAYFDLAYAAQQNKNYELVIRVLDARAKVQPDTPATYFLRAEAFDSLRMYKPAADNYKLFLAAANGKYPDQEFQARHRLKAIQPQ
jgi:tetratricopeptide (TPR) repeat protein